MKIEKKEIPASEMFMSSKYQRPGFYEVNSTLVVVNDNMIVWTLGMISDYSFLNESEQPIRTAILESTPSVSESFALKILAVAMNNHESLDKL